MFDEKDFLHELSRDGERSRIGAEYFRGLRKTANPVAQAISDQVKMHAPQIAAAVAGATIAGIGQYMASKPGKDGSASIQQRAAERMVEETKNAPNDYSGRMAKARAKAMKEMSDIMADHPGRSMVHALPAGATAGVALAAMAKRIRSFK